jgi:hypothetical protein
MKQPIQIDLTMNPLFFFSSREEGAEAKKIASWLCASATQLAAINEAVHERFYLREIGETTLCGLN